MTRIILDGLACLSALVFASMLIIIIGAVS
jgi:hypothetical protein